MTDQTEAAESLWMEAYLLSKCKSFQSVQEFIESGFAHLTPASSDEIDRVRFFRLLALVTSAESFRSRGEKYDRESVVKTAVELLDKPLFDISNQTVITNSLIPLLAAQQELSLATQLAGSLRERLDESAAAAEPKSRQRLKNLLRLAKHYRLGLDD